MVVYVLERCLDGFRVIGVDVCDEFARGHVHDRVECLRVAAESIEQVLDVRPRLRPDETAQTPDVFCETFNAVRERAVRVVATSR